VSVAALTSDKASVGFYGKLPTRGDFLRVGLPRRFIEPWDEWLQRVLPASRVALGDDWLACWLEAPVWRFALAAGLCGPDAVQGVWMPSVDSVGRYFPLTLACVGGDAALAARFLAVAERAGIEAIAMSLEPDAVTARIVATADAMAAPLPAFPDRGSLWWTDGAPRRGPLSLTLPGLPDMVAFTAMLTEAQTGEKS